MEIYHIVDNICKYINSKGMYKTQREIIENALWFTVSSYIGLVQPKININGKNHHLNFMGITIAGSGSGKSMSFEEVDKMLDINKERYLYEMKTGYDLNQEPTEQITIDGEKLPLKNFLPNDIFINVEGTAEGLYLRALALENSWCGSLNIINEEIFDILKHSTLNRMKELFDGKFNAKIIKGAINQNIYDVTTNMLLFGSSVGLKNRIDVYNAFKDNLNSGIYRRSFIYYQEPTDIVFNKQEKYDKSIIDFIKENIKEFLKENTKRRNTDKELVQINIENSALDTIEKINLELLKFSNEYKNDERFSAEVGSINKIIKLAGIIAVLRGYMSVFSEDIEYAYDYAMRCRNTLKNLFATEPPHKRLYNLLLKNKEPQSKSELLEQDIFNRSTFNEDLKLLEEYCYRKNKILIVNKGKIERYFIKELPTNKLDKIIVSVSTDTKGEKSIDYKPLEIPFFNERYSIEELVKSSEIQSFCLAHFKQQGSVAYTYRSNKTSIAGQNCIAYDFDGGSTIEYVQSLLKQFTYILYTTKSHTEENHRFRVILPTKTMFYVNNEQHSQMLENIGNILGLPTYDKATRNISRLWFTNPKAKVYKNKADLLDVMCCIPDTEQSEKSLSKLENENVDDITADRRINGMIKYTLANSYKGNRNNSLYKLFMFIKDIKDISYAGEITYRVNSMLDEPLNEREIQTLIRRANG